MFSPLRMIKTLTFVLLRIFWCGRSMETWTEEAFIFFNLTFIYFIINVYFNSEEAISDPCMKGIYFWWFEGCYLSQWWWTKDDESDWNPFFKILMTIEAFVWEFQYLPFFLFFFCFIKMQLWWWWITLSPLLSLIVRKMWLETWSEELSIGFFFFFLILSM